jgi:hypothetical protein
MLRLLVDGREIGYIRDGRVPGVGETPSIEHTTVPELAGVFRVTAVTPRWRANAGHDQTTLALAGQPFEVFEQEIDVDMTRAD